MLNCALSSDRLVDAIALENIGNCFGNTADFAEIINEELGAPLVDLNRGLVQTKVSSKARAKIDSKRQAEYLNQFNRASGLR